MKAYFSRGLGILATIALGSTLWASPLSLGLYNTGMDHTNVLLGNGLVDPHYTVEAAPGNVAVTGSTYTQTTGWPVVGGPWAGNNGISSWIRPTALPANPGDPPQLAGVNTVYTFTTTFTLTEGQALAAVLTGRWATDNNGLGIMVNNVSYGYTTPAESFQFHDFTLDRGFQAGTNEIQFLVNNIGQNGGNPAGLRVEFTSASVPDGGMTLVLLGGALLGLETLRRKFRA